jgi:hypothetical protein
VGPLPILREGPAKREQLACFFLFGSIHAAINELDFIAAAARAQVKVMKIAANGLRMSFSPPARCHRKSPERQMAHGLRLALMMGHGYKGSSILVLKQ